MTNKDCPEVKTPEEFAEQPEEYRMAVRKIVISHAINELCGSQVFDEPAIALAPTPYAKWLTCRVVMEEYGHHVRFAELGKKIGISEIEMNPQTSGKKPLSIMEYNMESWIEFCVIKAIGDLAEIIQVEDLIHCSFHPLRNLARMTMPEERFHAQFGEDFCTELLEAGEQNAVQDAVNKVFPLMPAFFGRPGSKNNEIYRKWGIKMRTNEEMRDDYIDRTRDLIEAKFCLQLPDVELEAA
ncbi:MAG: Phenylacetic acid catabolic protein [Pseudomonadota bacterium]|nr:Phenylacetic acid catabolic protein [Pseudomonadota bacterium]